MKEEKGSFDPDSELNIASKDILSGEYRTPFVPKRDFTSRFYSFTRHLPTGVRLRLLLGGMVAWGSVAAEKASAQIPEQPKNSSSAQADVVINHSSLSEEFIVLPKPNEDGGSAINVSPKLKLGFKDLAEKMAQNGFDVGEPVEEEEIHGGNGDGLLHTVTRDGKTGLFAWRKADNRTAWTDGGITFINGPDGLVSRPNNEWFPWEEQDRPAVAGIQATPTTLQPTPEPTKLPTPKEPEIIGTPEQIKAVRDAIELLRVRDPEHYTWVVNPDYVKTIKLVDVERSYVQSITKTISLHRKVFEEGLPRAASVIVHEASESKRVADWWKAHPDAISIPNDILNNELMYGVNAEIASITEEILTLKRCGGDPKMIAALESLINGLKNGTIAVQPGLGK